MRTTVAYTSSRILLLVIATALLYLVGARGLLLLVLAFLVSGIASFVLLSKQRDVMSSALSTRLLNRRKRATGFRARLEEGARLEDADEPGPPVQARPPAAADQLQAADHRAGSAG